MYNIGCCASIGMCGWMFLAFVISEFVAVLSSLPTRNVQYRLVHQYMCVGLCVSHLLNLASVGVHTTSMAKVCVFVVFVVLHVAGVWVYFHP